MLQKEFFQVQPFNPYPYWEGTVLVNLSGSQSFVEDTVFPKGVYRVDVVAGSTFYGTGPTTPMVSDNGTGVGGKVLTEVTLEVPFVIKAYCGSKGGYGVGGTNPYSGGFKANAWTQDANVPSVNHIFGNAGGSVRYINSSTGTNNFYPGGGNCLGDGVGVNTANNTKYGLGAGSCIHFLPVGGVFGTDYLFAAHCCPGATGWHGTPFNVAGNGSAYGGAAGGIGFTVSGNYPNITAYNGGSTPYGNGGMGQIYAAPPPPDTNGTGIGCGKNRTGWPSKGTAAFFKDGVWQDSTLYGEREQDGHIIVTFVRPI